MRVASYLKFGALVVLVTAIVVLAAPQHTSTAMRVALFLLAGAGAIALVDMARRRSPSAEASPFEPTRARIPAPGAPTDLVRFAVETRAFDAASDRGTVPTVVPGALRRTMRTIAASRLAVRPESVMPGTLHAALDGEPVITDASGLVDELEKL